MEFPRIFNNSGCSRRLRSAWRNAEIPLIAAARLGRDDELGDPGAVATVATRGQRLTHAPDLCRGLKAAEAAYRLADLTVTRWTPESSGLSLSAQWLQYAAGGRNSMRQLLGAVACAISLFSAGGAAAETLTLLDLSGTGAAVGSGLVSLTKYEKVHVSINTSIPTRIETFSQYTLETYLYHPNPPNPLLPVYGYEDDYAEYDTFNTNALAFDIFVHNGSARSYLYSGLAELDHGIPLGSYAYYQYTESSHVFSAYISDNLGNPFDYSIKITTVVPEPTTWALLLVGFGSIGAVMRRRLAQPRPA